MRADGNADGMCRRRRTGRLERLRNRDAEPDEEGVNTVREQLRQAFQAYDGRVKKLQFKIGDLL